ncbi:protein takeout-like isoform X1 [Tenebrio molitor]|uniref:protein takeout-like isoform X1 n=1 Tax=Tenebrio molitor TaxID=7067 RepID=UPI003624A355
MQFLPTVCVSLYNEQLCDLLLVASSGKFRHLYQAPFKKCNRKRKDFGECLAQAVEDAVGQLTKPFKEVGLNSLDPLEVPSMTIAPGSGPTNFQQNYKNMKITGFSKPKISKFDVNFDKKVVTLQCTFPKIVMAFDYDFNGKILLLPFYGKGPGTFSIDNMKYFITFNLEEYQKDGAKHFKITDSKLVIDPELIIFQFDNLFDGDENLGKNINQVFNDNWKEVFEDVKPSYEAAFGTIFTAMFNNLLEKVSISELFDE